MVHCSRPPPPKAAIAASESSGATPVSVVAASTALAAASQPGAVTSVAPGLSPSQAVGAVPSGGAVQSLAAPRTVCWSSATWHQWGTWPYEQRITDTTFWCAVYGQSITYHTSSVTTSGTLCGTNWRESQLIAGGVGFPTFTIRSSAGFACPTVIPWITLHPSRYEDIRRGNRGVVVLVGNS